MLRLDHIVVSALTLAEGVETVETALGLPLAPGGTHAHMATHNRLLGLGDIYLEVIAADPAQPRPAWPRWFDLDNFAGPPRLTNWICNTDDLDATLGRGPPGLGAPISLSRGDYRWRTAIPPDGRLPFGGAFPGILQWFGTLHPARTLPEAGARLTRLEIAHPQSDTLGDLLAHRLNDPRVHFSHGAEKAFRATIATPHGDRVLT